MKNLLLILATVIVGAAQANWLDPKDIRPDLQSIQAGPSNISEQEFRSLIAEVRQVYSPIVSQHGGSLNMSGNWQNETPNAQATQMFTNWQVQITGGLARRPELTADGFQLILCHELGHHLGGFAFAPSPLPFIPVWAANEGQSDYFATQVCAKRIWGRQLERNQSFRGTATREVQALCNSVWETEAEQNLCYRILVAGQSVTATMAVLMNKPIPSYSSPDETVVDKTFDGHPQPQCRMDTSLGGALCKATFNDGFIPGKKASGGVGGINAEREAASVSCMAGSGYEIGLRPACWFKARL